MLRPAQNKFSRGEKASRKCPKCQSKKIWKSGKRKTKRGIIQRYRCADCDYRFSPSSNLSTNQIHNNNRQVRANKTKVAKNLATVEKQTTDRHAGATKTLTEPTKFFEEFPIDIRFSVLTYANNRLKQGCTKGGVKSYLYMLRNLIRNSANLNNPESVKIAILEMQVSNRTKNYHADVYDSFLKHLGKTWNKPRYKASKKIPSIPLESEIDQLISGCSKTIATVLQTLKETGARIGEVTRIQWNDVDFNRNTIAINYPEKGSLPRQIKVSTKLITMIDRMPRRRKTIFAKKPQISHQYYQQRKRIAFKLNNPQLRNISLHDFRHWHTTMEYHKTKSILHVKKRLGHQNIKNTMIYTQLITTEGDEYHSATAETKEEVCKLIESGFEYVCTVNETKIFKKRK